MVALSCSLSSARKIQDHSRMHILACFGGLWIDVEYKFQVSKLCSTLWSVRIAQILESDGAFGTCWFSCFWTPKGRPRTFLTIFNFLAARYNHTISFGASWSWRGRCLKWGLWQGQPRCERYFGKKPRGVKWNEQGSLRLWSSKASYRRFVVSKQCIHHVVVRTLGCICL